jgi:hypothetical protein
LSALIGITVSSSKGFLYALNPDFLAPVPVSSAEEFRFKEPVAMASEEMRPSVLLDVGSGVFLEGTGGDGAAFESGANFLEDKNCARGISESTSTSFPPT